MGGRKSETPVLGSRTGVSSGATRERRPHRHVRVYREQNNHSNKRFSLSDKEKLCNSFYYDSSRETVCEFGIGWTIGYSFAREGVV
jgi:hypothetical protein